MYLPVIILAVGAFSIGLAIFMPSGIIPDIAVKYAVDEHLAGLALSCYSAGVVIGAPLLTLSLVNFNKKHLIIMAMSVFTVCNAIVAFAPTFTVFLIFRFIAGMFHGLYLGVSVAVAMRVLHTRATFATMLVFLGLTMSVALGVPAGSVMAHLIGVSYAFLFVSFLAVCTAIGVHFTVPSHATTHEHKMTMKGIVNIVWTVFSTQTLMYSYTMSIITFGYVFTAYTFVKPILRDVAEMPNSLNNLLLVLFGFGVVAGNFTSGKLVEHFRVLRPLLIGGIAGVVFSILFVFLIKIHSIAVIAVTTFFWGMVCYYMTSVLQNNVMKLARLHGHQTLTVVSSFNISAFSIGITLFSLIGAQVMANYQSIAGMLSAVPFMQPVSDLMLNSPSAYSVVLALIPLSVLSLCAIVAYYIWISNHEHHPEH